MAQLCQFKTGWQFGVWCDASLNANWQLWRLIHAVWRVHRDSSIPWKDLWLVRPMAPKFVGLRHRSRYCLHCLEVLLSRTRLSRYADVIWVSEALGPETCSLCTWASSIPSHSTCSLFSCHFIAPSPYICCLRGIKAHFVWVSGGRNHERYLYTPQSISLMHNF